MFERFYTALHFNALSPWAVVDILILAVIIYQLLLLIRGTRSVNVILAIVALVVFYVLTGPGLIELNAVHTALQTLLIYIPFAIIVLFQHQIRQALANLGTNPFSALIPKRLEDSLIDEVSLAAASLASKRLGALIIMERDMGLRTFYETGIALEALVSYDLLMNIFTRRSPMHDGAVIIAEERVKAAGCYLPLTQNASLSRAYGTRHRAAIGITEESDALAIVVSEERGVMCLAENGKIQEIPDAQTLQRTLQKAFSPREPARKEKAKGSSVIVTGPSDA